MTRAQPKQRSRVRKSPPVAACLPVNENSERDRCTYLFIGRVYPERAAVTWAGSTKFEGVGDGNEVPVSELTVEISHSQITAKMVCPSLIKNIWTAKNIVDESARTMLDAFNFFHGTGFEMDITQVIPPGGPASQFLIPQVPAVSEIARSGGLAAEDILYFLNSPQQWHLRRVLSDFRSAVRSPVDTGFYCFRAIETLKNGLAHERKTDPEQKSSWDAFREHYGIAEDHIRLIQDFAKGPRHGNVQYLRELPDSRRAELFTVAWEIVTTVFRAVKAQMDGSPDRLV